MKWRLFALLLLLALATGARADEIRLKDGSKIVGTIVGYEADSFRVQTTYGFALIRKDSVAEIVPGEPKKPAPASPPPAKPAADPLPAKPPALAPAAPDPAPALKPAALPTPPLPAAPLSPPIPAHAAAAPTPAKPATASSTPTPATPASLSFSAASAAPTVPGAKLFAAKNATTKADSKADAAPPSAMPPAAAPVPAPAPTPEPAPQPQPVRELVRGNLYINQTYGFQMYKPPDWELIEDAGKALPNAIGALGTRDETTLLVIGHDLTGDPLDAHAAATERALREIYEDYRPLSSKHITVAGLSAIENRSRGTLGGHDWSVIVVTFARGKEAFTILGMTYADSDLIQIQENVIARTIGSLQFTSPQ